MDGRRGPGVSRVGGSDFFMSIGPFEFGEGRNDKIAQIWGIIVMILPPAFRLCDRKDVLFPQGVFARLGLLTGAAFPQPIYSSLL